jgi:hypothetical protein
MLMRKGQESIEPVPGQKGKKKPGKVITVCWFDNNYYCHSSFHMSIWHLLLNICQKSALGHVDPSTHAFPCIPNLWYLSLYI